MFTKKKTISTSSGNIASCSPLCQATKQTLTYPILSDVLLLNTSLTSETCKLFFNDLKLLNNVYPLPPCFQPYISEKSNSLSPSYIKMCSYRMFHVHPFSSTLNVGPELDSIFSHRTAQFAS